MRKRNRIFLSLLLSLAMLTGIAGGYIPEKNARAAQESFQNLNQQEIVQAMGAGWNLGNQLEANNSGTPVEDYWSGVKVSERMIRSVKTSGFKSIRIPISWLSMIGKAPDYQIDESWMNRVQEVVDWAVKYNLYVIINIHGDGYSTVTGGWLLPNASDQDTIKAKYEAVWKQIADRFKDYDHHLIFESMNEVGADIRLTDYIKKAYKNINAYNQIFVDTVRQSGGNNDKRWLLIPGLNTNIDYTVKKEYGFEIPEDTNLSRDIPEGEKRIMISVHYYTPWEFCGTENYKQTQWGDEADPSKSVGYGGEEAMEQQFASLKEAFTDQGYPVVIGEYGSIDKSKKKDSGLVAEGKADPTNTEFRAFYAWKLCKLSIKNGCVPVYWDNGWNGDFGFAIFSRGNSKDKELGYRTAGTVTQPQILKSILSCYGAVDEGKATGITLDKKILTFDLTERSQKLEASIEPANADDMIEWESSDTSVANVSYKGTVTPKGIGTCLITASVPNGPSAYCIVKVTSPKSFKAGLYCMTNSWSQLACGDNDYITISKNGTGTYTMTLSGDSSLFQPIRTLFIKDVTVQRGVATESVLESAKFNIKSVTFNSTKLNLIKDELYYDKQYSDGALDFALLNVWYEEGNCIGDLEKPEEDDQGYLFPEDSYVEGKNTITVSLEVEDAVLNLAKVDTDTPISTLDLEHEEIFMEAGKAATISAITEPANATEKILWFSENPKIASVSQDGKITGMKAGETNIHILTASGIDVVCKIIVSLDPLATEEPTLPPIEETEEPDIIPTPAPTGTPNAQGTNSPNHTTDPNTTADPNATADPNDTADPSQGQTSQTPAPTQPPANNHQPAPTETPSGDIGTDPGDNPVAVKKISIKKVTSKKKGTVIIQWKKLSGVTGYQIKLGTNKKLTKNKKTITIKNAKTAKKTIIKLKSKKKYYIRIRAYAVDHNKKYYGGWSKIKTVKIK